MVALDTRVANEYKRAWREIVVPNGMCVVLFKLPDRRIMGFQDAVMDCSQVLIMLLKLSGSQGHQFFFGEWFIELQDEVCSLSEIKG